MAFYGEEVRGGETRETHAAGGDGSSDDIGDSIHWRPARARKASGGARDSRRLAASNGLGGLRGREEGASGKCGTVGG